MDKEDKEMFKKLITGMNILADRVKALEDYNVKNWTYEGKLKLPPIE